MRYSRGTKRSDGMKWTIIVLVIATISGAVSLRPVSAQAGSNLIIAGESIGQTPFHDRKATMQNSGYPINQLPGVTPVCPDEL